MNLLLAFGLVVLVGIGNGLSTYPCHKNKDSGIMGKDSTCTQIQIPPGLCQACPLRPTNKKGEFLDCGNIYNSEAPGCLQKMAQYAEANKCDKPRNNAVAALLKDPTDKDARNIVDYFLYATCELCCDCVPMNVQVWEYGKLAVKHTATKPTLWESGRGNCPAHAFYDICKLNWPVTQISKLGAPAVSGRKSGCEMLTKWSKSPYIGSWPRDAMQNIEPELRAFLDETQDALGCANQNVWKTCHNLEAKQSRLGNIPNPALQTPMPPAPSPSSSPKPSPSSSVEPKKDVELPSKNPTPSSSMVASKPAQQNSPALNPSTSQSPTPIITESTPATQVGSTVQTSSPIEPSGTTTPGAGVCFPASATVQLRDGRRVRMDALSIGDEVLVNTDGKYEPVYLFTHSEPSITTTHVRITIGAYAVTLSPSHHIGGRAARFIRRGDILQTVSGRHPVTSVDYIYADGLYNPHTMSGTIVVNDVLCSTFTETVETRTAHALLAPLRTLFRCGAVHPSAARWFLPRGARSLSIL